MGNWGLRSGIKALAKWPTQKTAWDTASGLCLPVAGPAQAERTPNGRGCPAAREARARTADPVLPPSAPLPALMKETIPVLTLRCYPPFSLG